MKFRLAFCLLLSVALAIGVTMRARFLRPPEIAKQPVRTPADARRVEETFNSQVVWDRRSDSSVQEDSRQPPKLELSREKLDWETRIEGVTAAKDLDDSGKSRELLKLLADLPDEAISAAAEEAVKRIRDSDYNSIALPIVTNPHTHGLAQSVLFADLMDRPNSIALPALLRIAQTPVHPYAKYARDNLNLLVGADFGLDWSKWEIAIQRALSTQH